MHALCAVSMIDEKGLQLGICMQRQCRGDERNEQMIRGVEYIFRQNIDGWRGIQDDQIIFFCERFENELKPLFTAALAVKCDI